MISEKIISFINNYIPFIGQNKIILAIFLFSGFSSLAILIQYLFYKYFPEIPKNINKKFNKTNILFFLKKPIFYSLIFFGMNIALFVWLKDFNIWKKIHKTILSLVYIVWLVYIFRIIKLTLLFISEKKKTNLITKQSLPLFNNLLFIFWTLFSIYVIASWIWELNMTGLLASMGIVGLALSLAAKDTLTNIFAGIFIFADKPYKIGDWVILKNGEEGKIIHIGLRSTKILDRDNVEITIPNSVIGSEEVYNQTGNFNRKLRLDLAVGVSYDTDIDKMEKVLLKIAEKNDEVLDEPESKVLFRKFGASSLDYSFLVWIKDPENQEVIRHQLYTEIIKQFRKNKIEIPYQKIDLNIIKK